MNERIYKGDDDQWYYHARGNRSAGPFTNRNLAELDLSKQIRNWSGRADPKATWPRHLHPSRIFRRSGTPQQ